MRTLTLSAAAALAVALAACSERPRLPGRRVTRLAVGVPGAPNR